MDPRSEVVIRQKDYLKGQVLLINAPADHMVQQLNSDTQASFWSWNFIEHQTHQKLSENAFFDVEFPKYNFDQAVIFVPKSKELLNYLLHVVVSHFKVGQSIFLVGEKKGGVERAAKQLQTFGKTLKLDSARHCQFWQLTLEKTEQLKPLESWVKTYDVQTPQDTLKICALPGVFSQNHLDIGTSVLLPYLKEVKSGKLADFGCGAGIIGSYLAKLHSSNIIHALDVDAFALASTKMTFKANGILDQQLVLQAVAGLQDAPTELDAIISNPPFHQGIHTHYDASEGLCKNAKLHLKPSGELWIVANRFLNYPVLIDQSFGQCTVKTDQQGFKVIYARAE